MKAEEFAKMTYENAKHDYGIFAPPTEPQDGLNILIDHFLGKDWYTANPVGQKQVNTEAIYDILRLNTRKRPLKIVIKDLIERW